MSSQTIDLLIGALVATLPGAWRCRVNAGTGWPGVSVLSDVESLICSFSLNCLSRSIPEIHLHVVGMFSNQLTTTPITTTTTTTTTKSTQNCSRKLPSFLALLACVEHVSVPRLLLSTVSRLSVDSLSHHRLLVCRLFKIGRPTT